MTAEIRRSLPGDEKQLREIWKTVFGDTDDYLDCFFENIYSPGGAIVASEGDKILSCVFLLPVGYYRSPSGECLPCTVSYAFATLPEYRRLGLGRSIAAAAVRLSNESGIPVNTICPAEDGLFEYYRAKVGYIDHFYAAEALFSAADLAQFPSEWGISSVSCEEYNAIREGLLTRYAHVAFSEDAVSYQEKLCKNAGGGLFAIDTGGIRLAAAAEARENGGVLVKELLAPKSAAAPCVKLLSTVIDGNTFFVRCPAESLSGSFGFSVRRFAMLHSSSSVSLQNSTEGALPWFGFAFD